MTYTKKPPDTAKKSLREVRLRRLFFKSAPDAHKPGKARRITAAARAELARLTAGDRAGAIDISTASAEDILSIAVAQAKREGKPSQGSAKVEHDLTHPDEVES